MSLVKVDIEEIYSRDDLLIYREFGQVYIHVNNVPRIPIADTELRDIAVSLNNWAARAKS